MTSDALKRGQDNSGAVKPIFLSVFDLNRELT
jgi:hypothetical protein